MVTISLPSVVLSSTSTTHPSTSEYAPFIVYSHNVELTGTRGLDPVARVRKIYRVPADRPRAVCVRLTKAFASQRWPITALYLYTIPSRHAQLCSWPKEQWQQLCQLLSKHWHDVRSSKLAEHVCYVVCPQPLDEAFRATKEDVLRPATHPDQSEVLRNSLRIGQGLAKTVIKRCRDQRAAQRSRSTK